MWYSSARLTHLLRGGEMPGSRPAERFPQKWNPVLRQGSAPQIFGPFSEPLGVAAQLANGLVTGLPFAADATNSLSTRTQDARAEFAARESIFERVCRAALGVAAGAWSDIDDNAHVDRRAPPGRNPSGRDQGKSNRGI